MGPFALDERRQFDVTARHGFIEFYEAALPVVHRQLSRLTGGDLALIEDLTQETFVGVARQVREGTMHRASVGLAVVAARHRFLDVMRRRRAEDAHASSPGGDLVWPDVAGAVVSADSARRLLARLTDEQRAALVLHHLDGLPVAEVAVLIDRSVHATESLIARAKRVLRAAPEVTDDA